MYSTCESTVKQIVGIDGILYDYIEQVEPEDPPEGAGLVAIERWNTARKKYEDADDLLIKDCAKSYGVLLSEASQTRVNKMPSGKRAMEECDPLGLVVATHMSNKRYGKTYNTITAVRNFYNNRMTAHEDLAAYYSRCRTLLFVKNEAYRLAEEDAPEHTDDFYSVLFITGLNTNYSEYVNTLRSKVRSWPQTMTDANQDAV